MKSFLKADCYTFTLIDGVTVLRYTSFDQTLKINGQWYTAHEVQIARSNMSWTNDLSVDSLQLTAFPIAGAAIKGLPFLEAIRCGMLDGATVALDKAFLTACGKRVVGSVNIFFGNVGEIQAGRTSAVIPVNSLLELLDTQAPIRVYQPACVRQLYDAACTVIRANYTATGTVAANKGAGDPSLSVIPVTFTGSPHQGSGVVDYYSLGIISFTSGANSGFTRSISAWDGSTVTVYEPLPFTPAIGDTITLQAGCDKTLTTCQNKFNNGDNFMGQPFIPVAETAL